MARTIISADLTGVLLVCVPRTMSILESDEFLNSKGLEPVDLNTFRAYHWYDLREDEVGKNPVYCTGDNARMGDDENDDETLEVMAVTSPDDRHATTWSTHMGELVKGSHILARVIPTSSKKGSRGGEAA